MFIIIEGGGNMLWDVFKNIADQQNAQARREAAAGEYESKIDEYSGEKGQALAKKNAAQMAQNQLAAAQAAAQSAARTSGMGKAASAALGGQAGGQAYSQNFQQGYQTELARNQQAIENAKAKLDEMAALENEAYQRRIGNLGFIGGLFSDENLKTLYMKIKETE